jgi:hypothetical protein
MGMPLPRARVEALVGGDELFRALAGTGLRLLAPFGTGSSFSGSSDVSSIDRRNVGGGGLGSSGLEGPLVGAPCSDGDELWTCSVLLAPSGGGVTSDDDRSPLYLFGDHFHVAGKVQQRSSLSLVSLLDHWRFHYDCSFLVTSFFSLSSLWYRPSFTYHFLLLIST